MKIDVKAFALASGIVTGLAFFAMIWWIIAAHKGHHGSMPWKSGWHHKDWMSPKGSLLGLAWGIFEGVMVGALFAWIYNALLVQKADKEEKRDVPSMVVGLIESLLAR